MTRYMGEFTYVDPGSDKPMSNGGTMMCVHCGRHWIPEPGSGKVRGWCMRCNGTICGPSCEKCIPVELRLDNLESGRPLDFRPITG